MYILLYLTWFSFYLLTNCTTLHYVSNFTFYLLLSWKKCQCILSNFSPLRNNTKKSVFWGGFSWEFRGSIFFLSSSVINQLCKRSRCHWQWRDISLDSFTISLNSLFQPFSLACAFLFISPILLLCQCSLLLPLTSFDLFKLPWSRTIGTNELWPMRIC